MKCVKFTPHKAGALQGFADMVFKATIKGVDGECEVEMPGFRLWQKEGRRWAQIPSREYEKDGEKKYAPLMSFKSKDQWQDFMNGVKTAILEFCEHNPYPEQSPPPPKNFYEDAPF